MFARAVLPFTVLLLIATDGPAQDTKKELAKLQGEWTVVSVDLAGQKWDADKIKAAKPLMIKDNEWTASSGNKFTFNIDPTKSPKQLDLQNEKTGKVLYRGIYKLEGDTLTFFRPGNPNGERPKEFKADADAGTVLLQFKRSGK